ncbi:hypothetical protein [Prochlorococcus sp. MIT 1201]
MTTVLDLVFDSDLIKEALGIKAGGRRKDRLTQEAAAFIAPFLA